MGINFSRFGSPVFGSPTPVDLQELLNRPLPSLTEILSPDDLKLLNATGDISPTEFDVMRQEQELRELDADWDSLAMICAGQLAKEANESVIQARKLRVKILGHGGISRSDYESIPKCYKRLSGMHMDDMATEMGYSDSDALYLAIIAAQNVLNSLPVNEKTGKRVNLYRAIDFLSDAEAIMVDEHGAVYDYEDSVPF